MGPVVGIYLDRHQLLADVEGCVLEYLDGTGSYHSRDELCLDLGLGRVCSREHSEKEGRELRDVLPAVEDVVRRKEEDDGGPQEAGDGGEEPDALQSEALDRPLEGGDEDEGNCEPGDDLRVGVVLQHNPVRGNVRVQSIGPHGGLVRTLGHVGEGPVPDDGEADGKHHLGGQQCASLLGAQVLRFLLLTGDLSRKVDGDLGLLIGLLGEVGGQEAEHAAEHEHARDDHLLGLEEHVRRDVVEQLHTEARHNKGNVRPDIQEGEEPHELVEGHGLVQEHHEDVGQHHGPVDLGGDEVQGLEVVEAHEEGSHHSRQQPLHEDVVVLEVRLEEFGGLHQGFEVEHDEPEEGEVDSEPVQQDGEHVDARLRLQEV